jgi:hypothetical protein
MKFRPESKVEAKPETDAWRSSEAILVSLEPQTVARKASAADWFKSLFGLSGRRAPADCRVIGRTLRRRACLRSSFH